MRPPRVAGEPRSGMSSAGRIVAWRGRKSSGTGINLQARLVAPTYRMVNRINPRNIPTNSQYDRPRRRPSACAAEILHAARNAVVFFLLAICAVAVSTTTAAQKGADSTSIGEIQSALRAGENEQALTLVHTQ